MNFLLISADGLFAVAKRHPEQSMPEYHALWEGRGADIHAVSSEPIEGIGCDTWTRIAEPGVVMLKRKELALSI